MMNRERDHQIRAREPLASVDDIADRFGVSRRTVFRAPGPRHALRRAGRSVEGEARGRLMTASTPPTPRSA
jgi:predicted DNA-binding transcriptional regulator YafY